MSIAASRIRQRRRDQERIFQENQSFIDEHDNTQRRHEWEHRSSLQTEQREVETITERLLQQEEEELLRRKQELQTIYNDEMSQWKETLRSSLEVSQEQRMEQIRSRAYELKCSREAEREQFVKECYERQWRNGCEELRAFDSKATLERITKDRELMIKSKRKHEEELLASQSEGEDGAMCLISKDEDVEQSKRRQSSLEFKRALDHQVELRRKHVESVSERTQEEEQEQLRQLAILDRRAKESTQESLDKVHKQGQELLEDKEGRRQQLEKEQKCCKVQNMILLQHALDLERRQLQAEQIKRDQGKNAAFEYVQCLREQAKVEAENTEHVNRIRDAELKRITLLNDEKMLAEKAAYVRHMEACDKTRQQQIHRKELEAEALRKEMDEEVAEMKAALLRAEELEKKESEEAYARRVETYLDNKAEMDRRANERENERQEKYRLQCELQNDQKVYQKRLEEQKARFGVSGVSDRI